LTTIARANPKEFRDDVVAVARKRESSLNQIAKYFGNSEATLSNWLKRAEIEDGVRPGNNLAESEREREQRLRVKTLQY
jgi:transposase-like protein